MKEDIDIQGIDTKTILDIHSMTEVVRIHIQNT